MQAEPNRKRTQRPSAASRRPLAIPFASGFGTWDYDSRTATYKAQMRFNWYASGFYHGYQQIEFEGLVLSLGNSVMAGTISAERHFVNGNPPVPNCGIVTQTRTP